MAAPLQMQLRSFRVLHIALMVSTGLYGVILFVVSRQPSFATTAPPPFDPIVFFVGAGALALSDLALVIPLLQKRLLPPRERDGGTRVDLADPEVAATLGTLLPKLRSGMIVSWALCESIAILGLVGGFVFHEPLYFAPFAVVAIAGFLLHAPTDAFFASFVRAARR